MSNIFVSGLVNIETTCKIGQFPIEYSPIDYNFFGVNMGVAGVGYNLAKSFKTLGDDVDIATMIGDDLMGRIILSEFDNEKISTIHIKKKLKETPTSAILYDDEGKRKIYCDLKDIQETEYDFDNIDLSEYDIVVACNINYNRPLLKKAKAAGSIIATDVHVLSDINDEYNKDFLEDSNILFLSDEGISGNPKDFIMEIEKKYKNDIIVLGQGKNGALMYVKAEDKFYDLEAAKAEKVLNTVGAGDSLFSSFICMYARNYNPCEALKKAQCYAAHKIGFDGAANGFMSLEELDKIKY